MSYDVSHISYAVTGSGPVAFLLHGNPATHTLWDPIVARCGGDRTLVAVDLPGFGGSPAPQGRGAFGLVELADILLRFADHLEVERFDLVGHSFGGGIATVMGARAPERLRTLALLTPLADRIPPVARAGRLRLAAAFTRLLWADAPRSMRQMIALAWTQVSYGPAWNRERAEVVALEADRPDLILPVSGLVQSLDVESYRDAIDIVARNERLPLLVIGAGKDGVIPRRQYQSVAERLRRGQRIVFENGGHAIMWQYPDEIAALLREHWSRAGTDATP